MFGTRSAVRSGGLTCTPAAPPSPGQRRDGYVNINVQRNLYCFISDMIHIWVMNTEIRGGFCLDSIEYFLLFSGFNVENVVLL